MSGQQHAPAALYPRERSGTHCTGGWLCPRAGLDGRKISPPPGFHHRTVQPVVSRYIEVEIPLGHKYRTTDCLFFYHRPALLVMGPLVHPHCPKFNLQACFYSVLHKICKVMLVNNEVSRYNSCLHFSFPRRSSEFRCSVILVGLWVA